MGTAAAIPAYNESATIEQVVVATRQHVDCVLVVDDGSIDNTPALAREAGAILLRLPANRGKGVALQAALEWARGQPDVDQLVLLDADGQHDPADIPRLLAEQRARQLDVLIGSRFLGQNNAPLYRLFGLHVLSASAALGSGVRLTDSQSGFRVLSRRAVERLRLRERSFAVESEMQFDGVPKGLRLGEAPIRITYASAARRNPVGHGVSVLIATIAMTARRRPGRLPLLVVTPVLAFAIARSRPISIP
jgi:glycosyltransferase involved in cell wall biosynthesis